jgi:hypothetical protein
MNATSNTTTDVGTNNNPWVESGAMVYVAITVATVSAVIMCCTWFITHNTALQRWWYKKAQYNGLDVDGEEEEIELIDEAQKENNSREESNYTDTTGDVDTTDDTAAFTLEANSSDSGSDELNEHVEAV